MADSAECARQKMATACTIADAGDEDHGSNSKRDRQLKRKRAAAVSVAPPLPSLRVAYRVALDRAICAALVTHLVRFLLYFRGQIPW